MIQLPDEQEMNELKAFDRPFCVTIYAPFIEPNGTRNSPNRIELKNLLRRAETALRDAGTEERFIRKTTRQARKLLDDHEFWMTLDDSLVLFMHPELFRYYHIPKQKAPYLLTVERGFNLDPLMEVLRDNEPYFLLALSHKNVRLYEGDQYRLRPVELKDFPTDMKEALNIDEYPFVLETHQVAPMSIGKGAESFHGQYNKSQTDKDMLLQFFRKIDSRLRGLLNQRGLPLVLAGVEYLQPIYRKANTYAKLLPQSIKGNQEHADLNQIRRQAWQLVSSS